MPVSLSMLKIIHMILILLKFFLFIVGVSIALVLHKQRKEARLEVFKKVLVRTIKVIIQYI
jgi:uncharacterized membrane protein